MRIFLFVKPGSRNDELVEKGDGEFLVRVKARAEGGAANEAVCRLVAKRFGVAPSRVRIVSGRASRRKVLEIA
jgi:hypothetical protein